MSTVEHAERETEHPGSHPPGPRRYRWLKPVIVFLLIAIPAGYLYISAMQSRGGSGTKQEQAAATGLEEGWPSRLQRRIYEVTVAPDAEDVAHFETNSWKSSSLYLQFTTTKDRLGPWLHAHGFTTSDFEDDDLTIDEDEAARVGWKFGEGHHWTGAEREEDKPKPSLEVVVNLDDPNRPRVFVVSTTTP